MYIEGIIFVQSTKIEEKFSACMYIPKNVVRYQENNYNLNTNKFIYIL